MSGKANVRTCEQLLGELETKNRNVRSGKLKWELLSSEEYDVYNITAPFVWDGREWIAGRVERRDSEHSRIAFFENCKDFWKEADLPELFLQDPFVVKIKDELIVGGVEVFESRETEGKLNYKTVFYRGEKLEELARFAEGPQGMKDIRLCELEDGRILVFTRPQGEPGGRGTIGYTFLKNINELNEKSIRNARLMEDQFIPEEWGGANELHRLSGGLIGVLSHIARFDEKGHRHYYSTSFCFDPSAECWGPMKMIGRRAMFQPGPSKRPDLEDVVFSGGIIRMGDGKAALYCGVSDAEGHMAIIEDPFDEYEEKEKYVNSGGEQ